MIILIILCLLVVFTPKVQAQKILFQDDFDDGEFSDWEVVRNAHWQQPDLPCLINDQPAQWEIVDGELGITIDSLRGCVTEIMPKELDLTGERAFRFEFDWHFKESTQMDRNVVIKWQDETNWYDLKILRDQILLQKIVNGHKTTQYNNWGYYPFEADETYHFKIEVVDNIITVWVEDQLIFQTIGHFPQVTGWYTLGLRASVGAITRSASYFDNLVVTSLSSDKEKHLGLSLFKQTDPDWADEKYDRADEWAEVPTIGRWGCALSSAAMVLRHYGINQLADGSPLNPSKLNQWLKNEPDGYIGDGLVNWLAISRLTALLSEKLKTPILEYSRLIKPTNQEVITYLDQQQPAILQIPGHFLIADGYQTKTQELLIKDPFFKYNHFDQHQSQLLSAGIYTPSQTDLSYLMFVTDPDVKLTLFNQSGEKIIPLKTHREYLIDQASELKTGGRVIQSSLLAKPATGTYKLQASSQNEFPTEIDIFLYNQNGQVEIFNQPLEILTTLEINYQPSEQSRVEKLTNFFTHWRRQLHKAYQNKLVVTYAFLDLDFLAFHASLATETRPQNRYRQLLIKKLSQYENLIDENTLISLTRLLTEDDL